MRVEHVEELARVVRSWDREHEGSEEFGSEGMWGDQVGELSATSRYTFDSL
jgi:hypothetical protein